jgi:hypothetical protein
MTTITTYEAFRDAVLSNDFSELIDANMYLKSKFTKDKSEKEVFQEINSNFKNFTEQMKKCLISEFSWDTLASEVRVQRNLTTFKGMTTMKNNNYMAYSVLTTEHFQKAFPLTMIQEYCIRPNFMFGTPIYDQALRLQCDLLQFFYFFNLKADFKFHSKISGNKYKIIDPFTRINIRALNRGDKVLREKYFNEDFNLKEFVYGLFDDFFPNVSWRYIGAGHFAHRITMQITEYLFEIGLWEYEDVEKLVKILLEKSENLITLEKVCENDAGKLSASFNGEMAELFRDLRESLSRVILHCMFLVSDKSFQESLSWKRK